MAVFLKHVNYVEILEINCKYQLKYRIEKYQYRLKSLISYRFKFSSIAHHYCYENVWLPKNMRLEKPFKNHYAKNQLQLYWYNTNNAITSFKGAKWC